MPYDLARYEAVFPHRAQRPLGDVALLAERLKTLYALLHGAPWKHMHADETTALNSNSATHF